LFDFVSEIFSELHFWFFSKICSDCVESSGVAGCLKFADVCQFCSKKQNKPLIEHAMGFCSIAICFFNAIFSIQFLFAIKDSKFLVFITQVKFCNCHV